MVLPMISLPPTIWAELGSNGSFVRWFWLSRSLISSAAWVLAGYVIRAIPACWVVVISV